MHIITQMKRLNLAPESYSDIKLDLKEMYKSAKKTSIKSH